MMVKGILGVYTGRPVHINIKNFGMLFVNLPKHQTVGKGASAKKEIVHIKKERFL